jgi:hypothetical protein
MPNNRFVINDETKYNSYGFRTANGGIDLSRFNNNPVMLDGHISSNRSVIGRWNDLATSGAELSANPEFDAEDENAKIISGKVERGFIKGASMGLLFNPENLLLEPNGKFVLSKCELVEVSIVPIPSNANALRLYVQKDGQLHLMNEDEIKLCLSALNTENNFYNKQENMKKVFLSVATLVALGLEKQNTNEGIDVSLIESGVADLKAKLEAAQLKLNTTETALKTLQDSAVAAKKLAVAKIIDDAIALGKIDATAKEEWLQLAMNNEALATTTLNALPAKKSLAAKVDNSSVDAGDVKTMDDFEKLPLNAQLEFKANNPEAYKKLFA